MRRRLAALLVSAVVALQAPACGGGNGEKITRTGEGKTLTAAELDADPVALLPGSAIGLAYVDAQQLFASQFGDQLLGILQKRLPLPPEAGFDPRRDLSQLYVGFYSMQGADVAGVAVGNFDVAAIEAAAAAQTTTPLGVPLTQRKYAGRQLFVASNIGFTVLTAHTAVFGNETGIRRSLDRIQDHRVKRQIPKWMGGLLNTPNAAMVGGADLEGQSVVSASSKQLPFLEGMQSVRAVGNFQPPGVNLAGTSSYADEAAATAGAAKIAEFRDFMQSIGWLASLVGLAQPIRRLEAQAEGDEAKWVAEIDGPAVVQLIDQLGSFLGVPSQPAVIDATKTQGVSGDPE